MDNKEVEVLLDFEIQTDKVAPARRPDIVVVDKTRPTATIIDVSVPADLKVRDKEDEILKYQDFRVRKKNYGIQSECNTNHSWITRRNFNELRETSYEYTGKTQLNSINQISYNRKL